MSEFSKNCNTLFARLFSIQEEMNLGQTEFLAALREFIFRLEVSHRVRIISVIKEAENETAIQVQNDHNRSGEG